MLSGHERLAEVGHQRMLLGLRLGDPADEVLAALLLDNAIAGCADDDVEEVRSLGNPVCQGEVRHLRCPII